MTTRSLPVTKELPTDLGSVLARSSSRLLADFAGVASLVVMFVAALNLPDLF